MGPLHKPNTPRRKEGTAPDPEPQRQKLEEDIENDRVDRAFSERHHIGTREADIAVAITAEDIAQAGKEPLEVGRNTPLYSLWGN